MCYRHVNNESDEGKELIENLFQQLGRYCM